MNLVKQLPIGLGLACLMFMSSCSKEEAVTPTSGSAVTNGSSNSREGGPVIASLYHFPSTDGPTCIACQPNNWNFKIPARDATSSLTAYAGNSAKKWSQPLSVPSTGSGSIITVVNDGDYSGSASALVENLTKGKKYRLTVSVSATTLSGANGPGPYSSYAYLAVSDLFGNNEVSKIVNLTNKKNQWVTETIEFEATDSRYYFRFGGGQPQGEIKLTYTNIHTGPNAVQQIN